LHATAVHTNIKKEVRPNLEQVQVAVVDVEIIVFVLGTFVKLQTPYFWFCFELSI
jgi:hypothetical protein